jgi:hypothetical protein
MNKVTKFAWEKKNLYNTVNIKDTPIYNKNNALLGYYNGISAIAHNGKCCGSISINLKDGTGTAWVRGGCYKYLDGWKLDK